ncbi:MAG: hypothetical protein AB7N76_35880 [Planctomycetota bacterium]
MTRAALLLSLTFLSACTGLWAQAISKRVGDDLLSLPSYEGRLSERGLLADSKAKVVRKVLYQRPWKVRAEVLEPESRKGDLSAYDGQTLTLWWPKELFGIRVRGLHSPTEAEVRAHLEAETRANLAAYAFHLVDEAQVAGQSTNHWKVIPKQQDVPYRLLHEAWMHASYSIPVRMDFFGPDGKTPWYGMQFESMKVGVEVPKDAFAFEFPPNAVVFEWDWSDPPLALDEARRTMNFTVRTIQSPPEGQRLRKVIKGRHDLPMLSMLYGEGATWLSLTENRNYAGQLAIPVGKKVKIGEHEGTLNFMGSFTVLSWTLGDTHLTLIGNQGFPTLIEVARSVR